MLNTLFGEKLHKIVAQSTFPSQSVTITPCLDHVWKFGRRNLWREAHVQVKLYKTQHGWSTFGSSAVQKFTRPCGAKHMSKSNCTKHTMSGPRLEVRLAKNVCALVARSTCPSQIVQNTPYLDHVWKFGCRKEAYVQVKMYKTHHSGTTFGR